MKSVLWRVAKRLSYIEDARCIKVKVLFFTPVYYESVSAVTKAFLKEILNCKRLTRYGD